jgi:hypothetical protein
MFNWAVFRINHLKDLGKKYLSAMYTGFAFTKFEKDSWGSILRELC